MRSGIRDFKGGKAPRTVRCVRPLGEFVDALEEIIMPASLFRVPDWIEYTQQLSSFTATRSPHSRLLPPLFRHEH